jgi:hypothetical protein
VLAELLEQGMRSTLKIPTHIPVPPTIASRPQVPLDGETLRALGTNPGVTLQHPGFYYYMAARCTEKRRERFIAAAESEVRATLHYTAMSPELLLIHNEQTGSRTTPGFANESKVDHLTIVQEVHIPHHLSHLRSTLTNTFPGSYTPGHTSCSRNKPLHKLLHKAV